MHTSLRTLMAAGTLMTLVGCSGGSDPSMDPVDETEDALGTQLVTGAAAVEIEVIQMASHGAPASKVILAAPSKLKKVVSSVKKRPANAAIPRCMPAERVVLHFLDAKGKEISNVHTSCGGFGNLWVGETSTPIKTTLDYLELSAQPLVPGDALWGITEVEVTQLATRKTEKVTEGSELTTLVAAIPAEQKIDPTKSLPRCMPSYSVSFKRADKSVANTSFICGASTPPAKLSARFAIEGPTEDSESLAGGAVELDPRPFVKLF